MRSPCSGVAPGVAAGADDRRRDHAGEGELFTGFLYTHDSWDEYWEGTLKRDNGNIGTLTTQTNTGSPTTALVDRLNVIAMVPYVWTRASQGVLHGIQGFQDLTLAAKFNAFEQHVRRTGRAAGDRGRLRRHAAHRLHPGLLPLSIGSGSTRCRGAAR